MTDCLYQAMQSEDATRTNNLHRKEKLSRELNYVCNQLIINVL